MLFLNPDSDLEHSAECKAKFHWRDGLPELGQCCRMPKEFSFLKLRWMRISISGLRKEEMWNQRDFLLSLTALLFLVTALPQLMMQWGWLIAFLILQTNSVEVPIVALCMPEWTADHSEMLSWEEPIISLKLHLNVNNQAPKDVLEMIIKMIIIGGIKVIIFK